MARYFFFSGPQSGNVNPTLAIAQGLVQQDNEVIYYLTDEYKDVLESTGATFRRYDSVMKNSVGKFQTDKQDLQVSAPWINSSLVEECESVLPNVSVMEGLSNGVPLVVVPQSGEQMLSAQRVEQLGMGLALHPRDVTISKLQQAVEQISGHASYRERARSLQQDIQQAGGYKAAVDAITTYTNGSTSC